MRLLVSKFKILIFAFLVCSTVVYASKKNSSSIQLKVHVNDQNYEFKVNDQSLNLKTIDRVLKIDRKKCNELQVRLFLHQLKKAKSETLKTPIMESEGNKVNFTENGLEQSVLAGSRYGLFLSKLPERTSILNIESIHRCKDKR